MDLEPLLSSPHRVVQVVAKSGGGLSLLARQLHDRGSRVGVVNQDSLAHISMLRETVIEESAIALEYRGVARGEMLQRCESILRALRLDHLALSHPSRLSGGELRRLAIAGVVVAEPDIVVLDDPFGGLDATSRQAVLELVRAISSRVIVLGHRFEADVGGESFSLIDATLVPGPPPNTQPTLPDPVLPSGEIVELISPIEVSVRAGTVLWLRGPNGSGKTTLMRAIAGLDGKPAPRMPVSLALQRSADQVAESTLGVFIGSDQLARSHGFDPGEHPLDLSAAELRVAQLVQVMEQQRPLVLIDEPDVGLDTPGRTRAHAEIAHGLSRGAAVIMSCHDPTFIQEVAHYAHVEQLSLPIE